jgi:hypothetical protein
LPNGTTPATLDPNTGTIQFTPQAGGGISPLWCAPTAPMCPRGL